MTLGIVGALIGGALMGAAIGGYWFAHLLPAPDTAPSNKSSSASSLPNAAAGPPASTAAASNGSTDSNIAGRLNNIERAIAAQRSDPALGNRIAEVAAQTKAVGDNLTTLTRRVDEIAGTSQSAGKTAEVALKAAETAKSASEATSKDQARQEDVEALARRVMALESAIKGLTAATAPLTSSGATDRAARLTVAAEALRAAVERGAPYQGELNAVKALGVDAKATAALEAFAASGVPSADALARELEALMPALQEASEPPSAEMSFVARLKSNAQKLVRITPLNAPAGNDPRAVVDRIRLDAVHVDIGAARADIDALPQPAKPLAAAWSKKAGAREAALAASRQIAADALAAVAPSSAR